MWRFETLLELKATRYRCIEKQTNIKHLDKGAKFLKKLCCCVGGKYGR